MTSLDLEVLSTRVRVVVPDRRWRAFFAELWAPFLARASDDVTLSMVVENDPAWGWRLSANGRVLGASRDWWFLATELRYRIMRSVIEDATDHVFVHAAVVARAETGFLLVARSGGGKTTVSLALAAKGWTYLGDDLAVVDPATGVVESLPVPAGIKDVDRWREHADRWRGIDPPRPENEYQIGVGRLLDEGARKASASAIVFLELDRAAAPSLSPISAAEATALLGPHVERRTPAAVAAYVALCRRARCARLRFGSPADATAALATML